MKLRAYLAESLTLLLVGLWCLTPARSQMMLLTGAGRGAATTAYAGPGDVVSGAQFWVGLRAYSLAKAGTKVANICNAGGTCADINSLANGNFDVATAQAGTTNCGGAGGTCTIKTLYDQTGNTNCGASACDFTNSGANRPTLSFACSGSKACAVCTGATPTVLSGPTNFALNQAINASFVYRTTHTAGNSLFADANGNQDEINDGGSANQIAGYAGTTQTASETDNAEHAVTVIWNGALGSITVDGSTTGSLNMGTGVFAAGSALSICSFNNLGSFPWDGKFYELGIWGTTAFTGTQLTNMYANQHTYWGF